MSASQPQRFGDLAPSEWPGQRLGLPESGPRSVARIGRRVLAIMIDWGLAALPAFLLIGGPYATWWNWAFFAAMQMVFIPTIGGSLGHRILGLRVVPIAGGWVGPWRPIVRTALICLVIPVLVWDSDQRGFHDKIAGTVLIRNP
ncbi:RDD family protein [Leucobacter luti]|uniref:RDD family protein n=1 Tax=Leucobacter luti TaxID=340320 RepID=A0A4V3CXA1_9MICO|nr:RDD family protein [Leucobacter luti]MCW2287853.1 putative RDD family membrane protein YckC [Leucobacter luti]TCK45984.1 RDD family protein [Leucobacter luti]TDP89478.1 RDD family protein [Leucobacter luti]